LPLAVGNLKGKCFFFYVIGYCILQNKHLRIRLGPRLRKNRTNCMHPIK